MYNLIENANVPVKVSSKFFQYLFKIEERPFLGVQLVFKFPNRYGASLIQGPFTYGGPEGLFEVGIIRFVAEDDFELDYDVLFEEGVVGYLAPEECLDLFDEIYNLPEQKLLAYEDYDGL